MFTNYGLSWFYVIAVITSFLGYQTPCYRKLSWLPVIVNPTNHKEKARSSVHRVIQGGECVKVDFDINSAESGSMAKTDNRYTAVQMEEKKSKEQREPDLEEPFNEEFWLKVRLLLLTCSISALLQFVLIFTKCDLSIIFLDISMTCSFILLETPKFYVND